MTKGIILSQICAQIEYFTNSECVSTGHPNIIPDRINILLIHNLIIIPLLVRVFCLGESIKYNYHHITRKFYDENFQTEVDEHFKNKYYTRNFYYIRMFIIPLAVIYIGVIILISIPSTECSIDAFLYSLYKVQLPSCNGRTLNADEILAYEISGTAIANGYLMCQVVVFMTLLYRVFKYPIENDKFLLKFEFISLFVIWTLCHNVVIGFTYLFEMNYDINYLFYFNSMPNFFIAFIYAYVTYKRKSITSKEIRDMMKDFDSFMYCHVSFTFFRDYIKSYHEDEYKLLSFWIEYHLFKRQTKLFQEYIQQMYLKNETQLHRLTENKSLNISLNTQEKDLVYQKEDQLREMADHIFSDYFTQNRSNTNSPVTTTNFMNIEFPVDIYEKIEDAYKNSFNVENLIELYDEAHSYVCTKLFNLFMMFCRNEKEYKKFERVVFFIDFYEIKRIAI